MTWAEAFFEQAQSDYAIFKDLCRLDKPKCHQLHYLQMATEKLAKAYMCKRAKKDEPPKTVHAALSKFLRFSKDFSHLRQQMGYHHNYMAYCGYINSVIPIAEAIENLAPSGQNLSHPNPEYPFDTDKGIISPVKYEFKEIELNKQYFLAFDKLIIRLIQIFPSF